MSWSTIRKATEDDHTRLIVAAERACERFHVPFCGLALDNNPISAIEDKAREDATVRKSWRAAARRALGEPAAEGIAWGCVGYHVP